MDGTTNAPPSNFGLLGDWRSAPLAAFEQDGAATGLSALSIMSAPALDASLGAADTLAGAPGARHTSAARTFATTESAQAATLTVHDVAAAPRAFFVRSGTDLRRPPPNWLRKKLPDGSDAPRELVIGDDEASDAHACHIAAVAAAAAGVSPGDASSRPGTPPSHARVPTRVPTRASSPDQAESPPHEPHILRRSDSNMAEAATVAVADGGAALELGTLPLTVSAGGSAELAKAYERLWCVTLADCLGSVDYVAHASLMRALLRLPFTRERVSVVLHRVAGTLVVGPDPFPAFHAPDAPVPHQHEGRHVRAHRQADAGKHAARQRLPAWLDTNADADADATAEEGGVTAAQHIASRLCDVLPPSEPSAHGSGEARSPAATGATATGVAARHAQKARELRSKFLYRSLLPPARSGGTTTSALAADAQTQDGPDGEEQQDVGGTPQRGARGSGAGSIDHPQADPLDQVDGDSGAAGGSGNLERRFVVAHVASAGMAPRVLASPFYVESRLHVLAEGMAAPLAPAAGTPALEAQDLEMQKRYGELKPQPQPLLPQVVAARAAGPCEPALSYMSAVVGRGVASGMAVGGNRQGRVGGSDATGACPTPGCSQWEPVDAPTAPTMPQSPPRPRARPQPPAVAATESQLPSSSGSACATLAAEADDHFHVGGSATRAATLPASGRVSAPGPRDLLHAIAAAGDDMSTDGAHSTRGDGDGIAAALPAGTGSGTTTEAAPSARKALPYRHVSLWQLAGGLKLVLGSDMLAFRRPAQPTQANPGPTGRQAVGSRGVSAQSSPAAGPSHPAGAAAAASMDRLTALYLRDLGRSAAPAGTVGSGAHRPVGHGASAHAIGPGLGRLEALDLYLDLTLAGVQEVAFCYHVEGRVRGYQVVQAHDVPALCDPPLSPAIIEHNAALLLQYVQSQALHDGHTYWLYRGAGATGVSVLDVTGVAKGVATRAAGPGPRNDPGAGRPTHASASGNATQLQLPWGDAGGDYPGWTHPAGGVPGNGSASYFAGLCRRYAAQLTAELSGVAGGIMGAGVACPMLAGDGASGGEGPLVRPAGVPAARQLHLLALRRKLLRQAAELAGVPASVAGASAGPTGEWESTPPHEPTGAVTLLAELAEASAELGAYITEHRTALSLAQPSGHAGKRTRLPVAPSGRRSSGAKTRQSAKTPGSAADGVQVGGDGGSGWQQAALQAHNEAAAAAIHALTLMDSDSPRCQDLQCGGAAPHRSVAPTPATALAGEMRAVRMDSLLARMATACAAMVGILLASTEVASPQPSEDLADSRHAQLRLALAVLDDAARVADALGVPLHKLAETARRADAGAALAYCDFWAAAGDALSAAAAQVSRSLTAADCGHCVVRPAFAAAVNRVLGAASPGDPAATVLFACLSHPGAVPSAAQAPIPWPVPALLSAAAIAYIGAARHGARPAAGGVGQWHITSQRAVSDGNTIDAGTQARQQPAVVRKLGDTLNTLGQLALEPHREGFASGVSLRPNGIPRGGGAEASAKCAWPGGPLPNPAAAATLFARAADAFTAAGDTDNSLLAKLNTASVLRTLGAAAAVGATSGPASSHESVPRSRLSLWVCDVDASPLVQPDAGLRAVIPALREALAAAAGACGACHDHRDGRVGVPVIAPARADPAATSAYPTVAPGPVVTMPAQAHELMIKALCVAAQAAAAGVAQAVKGAGSAVASRAWEAFGSCCLLLAHTASTCMTAEPAPGSVPGTGPAHAVTGGGSASDGGSSTATVTAPPAPPIASAVDGAALLFAWAHGAYAAAGNTSQAAAAVYQAGQHGGRLHALLARQQDGARDAAQAAYMQAAGCLLAASHHYAACAMLADQSTGALPLLDKADLALAALAAADAPAATDTSVRVACTAEAVMAEYGGDALEALLAALRVIKGVISAARRVLAGDDARAAAAAGAAVAVDRSLRLLTSAYTTAGELMRVWLKRGAAAEVAAERVKSLYRSLLTLRPPMLSRAGKHTPRSGGGDAVAATLTASDVKACGEFARSLEAWAQNARAALHT
jgi:hypothetical protein